MSFSLNSKILNFPKRIELPLTGMNAKNAKEILTNFLLKLGHVFFFFCKCHDLRPSFFISSTFFNSEKRNFILRTISIFLSVNSSYWENVSLPFVWISTGEWETIYIDRKLNNEIWKSAKRIQRSACRTFIKAQLLNKLRMPAILYFISNQIVYHSFLPLSGSA